MKLSIRTGSIHTHFFFVHIHRYIIHAYTHPLSYLSPYTSPPYQFKHKLPQYLQTHCPSPLNWPSTHTCIPYTHTNSMTHPPPSQPISWKTHKHACTPPPPHTPTNPHIHLFTCTHTHTHTQTLRPTWKKDIPRATPPIGPMLPLMKSTTRLWQPWNSYYTSRILYTFFTSIMNNIHFFQIKTR